MAQSQVQQDAASDGDSHLKKTTAEAHDAEIESGSIEDSPFDQVQAVVPPFDDPELPVNTFRGWFLGIVSTLIFSGILQFFQLHSPPIFLSSNLVIIITLPVGHFMARVLPSTVVRLPSGWEFSLNPGPFNHKEHTITAIMTSLVSAFDNGSLASDVYVAFDKFLGIPISPSYRLLFLLSTQALSFGFVGLFYRFLVQPAFCVWPGALPTCSMIYGFHDSKFQNVVANGWKMHRMKFFWVVPSFLFTALTTFAWITWIRPNDVTLNQVFGATTGMDLLPLTLDWNQISGYLGTPLVVPSWAILNVLGGSVFFLWIVSPALHWQNVWYGRFFPFSSSSTFDNTGAPYNTSRVMNPDYSINDEAYAEYSPVFLSTTSVLSYGLGFASVTSILVHTALYHREMVWGALKATISKKDNHEGEDIHGRLMRAYKPVPIWWYGGVFAALIGISMAFLYVENTQLPWWGLIISILLNIVLLIPIGLMKATCNITVNTGVLAALIGGFIWPGNMMNNVVFKVFTLVCTFQGLGYIQSMKMGYYMKIFRCPLANGYAANAVFWGLIGPTKLFKSGSMYNSMLWFFLIGALLPVIVYLAARRFPKNKFLQHTHTPVIFASTSSIPPATAANCISWGLVGLAFNMLIKRRYHAWWTNALAITTFLVFFCLTYPGVSLRWWGNSVQDTTADGMGVPLDTVPMGETFGPSEWL
ncbi:hypothetical protein LCI18_003107 [Fusarium solani-melongenae]|uniref:Uncharacterized protein n=1 Tax=Fusarium solani subsp. cucurbitae TaxID=2747967 RepID=A0ACD3YT74_FUSSC|nr:hypothetical protein LCI18_003107 [Fusarium solani-melongenae]